MTKGYLGQFRERFIFVNNRLIKVQICLKILLHIPYESNTYHLYLWLSFFPNIYRQLDYKKVSKNSRPILKRYISKQLFCNVKLTTYFERLDAKNYLDLYHIKPYLQSLGIITDSQCVIITKRATAIGQISHCVMDFCLLNTRCS